MNDSPPPGIDNTAHYCNVVLFVALSVRLKVDKVWLSASFMEPVLVPYPTMYISVVERRETTCWDEFGVWRTCFLEADGIRIIV